MEKNSFMIELVQLVRKHRMSREHGPSRTIRALIPHLGTLIFTLLIVAVVLMIQSAAAGPFTAPRLPSSSATTISYQGRLANSAGQPITATVAIQFRLYDTNIGGAPLWNETQAAVPVENGLFHVLLGSNTPIPLSVLAANTTVWLGITVGGDTEMTPREQIASAPYSMISGISNSTLGFRGWERDESSTGNPIIRTQSNLAVQHGYAQHIVTAQDLTTGYYDHVVTFPTPFQTGSVPTITFTYTGESGSTNDVPKGGTMNGGGDTLGRLFSASNAGFTIRGRGTYEGRRDGFHWIAVGTQP